MKQVLYSTETVFIVAVGHIDSINFVGSYQMMLVWYNIMIKCSLVEWLLNLLVRKEKEKLKIFKTRVKNQFKVIILVCVYCVCDLVKVYHYKLIYWELNFTPNWVQCNFGLNTENSSGRKTNKLIVVQYIKQNESNSFIILKIR